MVVIQYPDSIEIETSDTSELDENGNWVIVEGPPGGTAESICRYEPNDGSVFITAADGTRVDFSGIVYLPLTAPRAKEGSPAIIRETRDGQDDFIHEDIVKRFSRGQLNCRIWV